MKYNLSSNDEPWSLFDPLFDDFFTPSKRPMPRNMMSTDIEDKGDHYVMSVDLPGFDKKDISVDFEEGYLTIKAKKEETVENKTESKYVRRERVSGSATRSFYLGDIEQEKISATFENGVLVINLPKVNQEEVSKKRAITIG